MTTPFKASVRPDVLLRKYAWFEDPAPAPNPPPDPAPSPDPKPEDKKFTQADMDRVAGSTRTEARKTALTDFLKELGFDKPDDLKTLVKSAKEQDEAKKTEAQKLADAKTQAEKERDEAKAALESERQQRLIDRRDSAIRTRASKAYDVNDVLAWAQRADNKALLDKTVKDDGTVDEKAVDALIAACEKNAAHLWKRGGVGSPSNNNGREAPADPKKLLGDRPFGSL